MTVCPEQIVLWIDMNRGCIIIIIIINKTKQH